MKMFLLCLSVLAFGSFTATAELTLVMTAQPAHPVVGDVVTWQVNVGGVKQPAQTTFAWNADIGEFPSLYDWAGDYPFLRVRSVSNVYNTAGDKTLSVAAYNGDEWVERSLTIHVSEAEIQVTSPSPNAIWRVGHTYEITWSTRGRADQIQIGLWDPRYNSEVGNAGEAIIAFKVPNTGHFRYTVPVPSADGISAGNVGGRNYKVSVGGWNDCVPGFSKKFIIVR